MKRIIPLLITLLFFQLTSNAQPCLPDGITFTTQAQIDSFPINYPNCTDIEGFVDISGENIKNLNGLKLLDSIGNDIYIIKNDSLIDLSGLDNLQYVGGNLSIWGNDVLTSLTGLEKLNRVERSLRIGYYVQPSNPALINLTSLNNLKSIGGDLVIAKNYSLISLSGLGSLTSVKGDLFIGWNNLLSDITDLKNLSLIGKSLRIGGTSLTNLSGLEMIDHVDGHLRLRYNPKLEDISALQNIIFVRREFDISGCDVLTNLDAFKNILYVGEGIIIEENEALNDITGLTNINSVIGDIIIKNNASLTSLSGLDNFKGDSIISLSIYENPLLSECDAQSICDYITNTNGNMYIKDNYDGCNSQSEVAELCTDYINENRLIKGLNAYPNPFTTSTTIEYELNQPEVISLSIFNHLGEQVGIIQNQQSAGKQQVKWNA